MNTRPTRPPLPLAPLGYRRDGRPILPVLGASEDDPTGQEPDGTPDTGGTPPPQPGQVTLSQDELTRRFTREKDQGRRAGVRELLSQRRSTVIGRMTLPYSERL
ncbi:hypothetical protein BIV25_38070 [Streptomyces sp. MUSC 14]|uniref:hypothetical protein n=1 Tax=Streptomyces sp. MUSC 14 TaxID=1354889 RepID=UPI0008F5A0A0|nr:hypothetical protein [Streptomyces sp. MUSC 14]OIJ87766.1 hypothetical protein BIV25_38070 [Streptomyces sp. MUSC 14]